MKKCPECGNPSYDGAPVCGNCGYKFPKPKVTVSNKEDIFKKVPKEKKNENNEDIVEILKENRLVIGAIIIITLIVILGIVISGNGNDSGPNESSDLLKFTDGDFSFKYPSTWKRINETDADVPNAVFFKNKNKTTIEVYNVTYNANSIKQITQERLNFAVNNDYYIEKVETITLDGRNVSDIILENYDGDYTRFVSMFSDGKLYVFKISGDSVNSVTADDIENTLRSADIK